MLRRIDHASRSTAGASLCIDLLGVWLEDFDRDHCIEHDVLVLNSQNHVGPSREIVKSFVDHIYVRFPQRSYEGFVHQAGLKRSMETAMKIDGFQVCLGVTESRAEHNSLIIFFRFPQRSYEGFWYRSRLQLIRERGYLNRWIL